MNEHRQLEKTIISQRAVRQDKTIVEHIHVLEEAKRVTDKELARTQIELEKKDIVIRSLQTMKSKMQTESEDLALKYTRELRSKEQEIKDHDKKFSEVLVNLEKERRGREEAELNIHRVQTELRQTREQAELQSRYETKELERGWRKEKDRLESKIVDLEKTCNASSEAQIEQQSQIVSLQSQVRELRCVLDEAEVERTLLQKARRALQAELESLKIDHSESKPSSDDERNPLPSAANGPSRR